MGARLRFVDLFAGTGGFHLALAELGHQCVFASEIDDELRKKYIENFPGAESYTIGDIRSRGTIPDHDILCAGFPCQPFSKSGRQEGMKDKIHGTLWAEIVDILEEHQTEYVILENVGNFERHDQGKTWAIVRESLDKLGYNIAATLHVTSGGQGLVSPHHLGYPQQRERFFAVASRSPLPTQVFPKRNTQAKTSLREIIQRNGSLTPREREETRLTEQQRRCVEHWNKLLAAIPSKIELPSFPIWSDEWGARYPYQGKSPHRHTAEELRPFLPQHQRSRQLPKREMMALLPSYAREPVSAFPPWKKEFIRQNREWYKEIQPHVPDGWLRELRRFPPSLRKLEWNTKGGERNLWRYVLQFRPSGLRTKRYTSSPALVAMTSTQIPILGPKRRFLTRKEGLRLQGFPTRHKLPDSRADAFRALGNAVHVGVVKEIARNLLSRANPVAIPAMAGTRAATETHSNGHSNGTGSRPLLAHTEAT